MIDWILAKDKVPDDDEYKVVTVKSGKKGLRQTNRAYYLNGAWHGPIGNGEVIAWADLKPYQGDITKEGEDAGL